MSNPTSDSNGTSTDRAEETSNLWLATQVERSLTRQESARNTSLLLATFTEGIAAALVASALQVGQHRHLMIASSVLLAAGFIAIFLVLFQDRTITRNLNHFLSDSPVRDFDVNEFIRLTLSADLVLVQHGALVARSMRNVAFVQAVIAAAASTLAVVAMLIPAAT